VTTSTAGTLTITGPSSSSLTISGNNGDLNRSFNIFTINSGGDLSISGVTVSGAKITSGNGGAFNNLGTLFVTDSTISNNDGNPNGGSGGGIANNGGTLRITNSIISDNTAYQGAGIGNFNGGNLTILYSTISGNSLTSFGGGGGIRNYSGTLTVSNSIISGNSGNSGGGILNNGTGTFIVSNSTISGNSASGGGAGIFNYGIGTVLYSTLSGNISTSGLGQGGGIYNTTSGGNLTISNSTLTSNSALKAGGIWNNNSGIISISNSTLSGNISTSGKGGGIYNRLSTLTISNSTLSGNSATNDSGGGIFNNGTLNIANTIIANSPSGGDFAGTAAVLISGATAANNLITIGATGSSSWATTVTTGDLNLGTLQNNGGPTFTMALGAGSSAIGTGSATISNAAPINGLDQRGVARSATAPNIGAFENAAAFNPNFGTPVSTATGYTVQITNYDPLFNYTGSATANGSVSISNTGLVTVTGVASGTSSTATITTTRTGYNSGSGTVTGSSTSTPLVTGSSPPANNNAIGLGTTVNLYDPVTSKPIGIAVPFPGFMGQVRVASGDFNNDGINKTVAGAGPGGGPAITILDSQTGAVMKSFFAFDPAFTGGVFVTLQDANNDGILDIIVGADAGGGPEVRIFNGANLQVLKAFYAYDPSFRGGVSVATIDLNGDGILDLVTGAGRGGAPHVKVFDGATNSIISQWYAYSVDFTGGVFVAAGDLGNDGTIEVVTGPGSGGAPQVGVWNPYTGELLTQFLAYAPVFNGGVRVSVSDGNADGVLDLITGAGPAGGPHVKVFSYPTLDLLFSFYSGESTNPDGVFVS